MPNYPPLSELPGFLPAGEPGSPERIACALGTFTDLAANAALSRHLKRRLAARPQPHSQPITPVPAVLEKERLNVP